MANNKVKVNGRQGQSSRPLSSDHITTLDFNVVKPVGIYEMIPGDTIHITPEMWMRTQALACPTFGKVDIITRAFFVPHRLVMSHFLDFWRQQSYRTDNDNLSFAPSDCFMYNMHSLSTKFVQRFSTASTRSDFETHKVEPSVRGTSSPYDFYFGLVLVEGISPSSASDYSDFTIQTGPSLFQYRFNPLGKRVYDLFVSMGYRFQFFGTSSGSHTTHNQGEHGNEYVVSLLPVLSWLKIFQDWYCPSEFRDIFNVDVIKNKTFIDNSDVDDILDMLTFACYIFYNDDMFSLCEKAPFAKRSYTDQVLQQIFSQPKGDTNDYISWENSFKVAVDRKYGGILSEFGKFSGDANTYMTLDGKPFIGSPTSASSAQNVKSYGSTNPSDFSASFNNIVSAWSVRAVVKAATWLQRNNLLPSRANDYLRAKFGVSPSSERLDIAEYIGSASKPLQISDVVSTEATDNKLGELGGKGTAYSIDKLSYHADEFGYFFVSVEVRPRVDYGQGVDPLVLRTKAEDFYQQELDGLGFTPVPTQCVVGGPITGLQPWNLGDTYNLGNIENRIFGYLPKYWSYKIKHGNLSGDFGIPNNIDIQSFHLMRYVGGSTLNQYVQNSLSFRYPGLSFYDNQFARIFMDSSLVHLKDHFQMICSFDVDIVGEMLALNESWMVNDEHDERRGSEMEIQSVL